MSDSIQVGPTYEVETLQERVSGVVFALMAVKRKNQQEIAYQLEISPSTLSLKLSGRRRWSIDDLAALGVVFNVNPVIFLKKPEEVFAAVLDANRPDDEVAVRRQGLEPRTRCLGDSPSHGDLHEACTVTYLDQYRAGHTVAARLLAVI